jgi:acetyl-CoA carboxylase carboxyl transferase subunit alpha
MATATVLKKEQEKKSSPKKELSAWERVEISRHVKRPQSSAYIENICTSYVEIFGDRSFRDDTSIICVLAYINDKKFIIIGQEKGNTTESRLFRNFGMSHPEGYKKALRAMKLAEKFNLPVVTLIDTPGAFPGLAAEERGQGWAISQNLFEMSYLKIPIISIVIGEGCSGGALGIGVADKIAMLSNSYYSVISPEGCASILWKDSKKNKIAAGILKMHPENLIKLDIVDDIIIEPDGGAHIDPSIVYQNVKSYILSTNAKLAKINIETLIENRYNKYRNIGKFITI